MNFIKNTSLLSFFLIFTFFSGPSVAMKEEDFNQKSILTPQKNLPTGVPVGSIIAFAGDKEPEGWLMCDGSQHSSKKYPKLYEVIQEKYAPSNSWTIEANKISTVEKFFHVPDLRGRILVGVDNGSKRVTSNNTLGATGGEEKHQLTIEEMPEHNHAIGEQFDISSGNHATVCQINKRNHPPYISENIGGNQTHNNMQPYLVSNYIIKGEKDEKLQQNSNISQVISKLEKQIEELKISQRGCAKAWIIFDGSNPDTLNSIGVKSVTRHGVGDYTINFSTPFNSENYCPIFHTWGGEQHGILLVHAFPRKSENREVNTRDFYRFTVTKIQENGIRTDAFVSAAFYGN